MAQWSKAGTGQFCWADLAAIDAERAKQFYRDVLGWTARDQPVDGGSFTRLGIAGQDVGSLYQLKRAHLERGVPSHWTPYVQVDDVEAATRRVHACGGEVIVRPFAVAGVARIALIVDGVGAHLGLWERVQAADRQGAADG